jgi:hypothetical protein
MPHGGLLQSSEKAGSGAGFSLRGLVLARTNPTGRTGYGKKIVHHFVIPSEARNLSFFS